MRDITTNPAWERAYGLVIPVLTCADADGNNEVRLARLWGFWCHTLCALSMGPWGQSVGLVSVLPALPLGLDGALPVGLAGALPACGHCERVHAPWLSYLLACGFSQRSPATKQQQADGLSRMLVKARHAEFLFWWCTSVHQGGRARRLFAFVVALPTCVRYASRPKNKRLMLRGGAGEDTAAVAADVHRPPGCCAGAGPRKGSCLAAALRSFA